MVVEDSSASASIELLATLLPEVVRSDADAVAILDAAAALGVDPIDYCLCRHHLDADEIMARAAGWAGLQFSRVVPAAAAGSASIDDPETLPQLRSINVEVRRRKIMFLAPLFHEVLYLKRRLATHPESRDRVVIAPAAAVAAAVARSNSRSLLYYARHALAARWPGANALHGPGLFGRGIFVAIALTLLLLAFGAAYLPELLFLPLIGVVIVIPAALRLGALFAVARDDSPPPLLSDADLPVYSVLIPLRHEAHMVPLLYRAMSALSYPPEKLEVRFVVEARSARTIAAVRGILGDPRFGLIEVPDAAPRTKPKALDYALSLVQGEYVVVYDAEDIPNSDQLRLAASTFAARPDITCLQAELVVDNARENLLTALFTGEYAGQFGFMMPALARWRLPVPLGGTSNHFRLRDLRAIGGWDAFNVTEDADLGLRLARLRQRVAMLPSQTYEEQPITIGMWLRQRTRWMKGWMQTFIVHNQHPVQLAEDLGSKAFLAFEIYVGSIILSPLLHTAFLANLLVETLLGGRLPFLAPVSLSGVEITILVLGYGTSFLLAVAGLLRFGQRRLLIQQLVLPVYWMLHSIATIRAGYDLLKKPHFWDKTTHGLTRLERSFDEDGGR